MVTGSVGSGAPAWAPVIALLVEVPVLYPGRVAVARTVIALPWSATATT